MSFRIRNVAAVIAATAATLVAPLAALAGSLPTNDGRDVLAYLAEPYSSSAGTAVDPLPADGKNAWISTIDQFQAQTGARAQALLHFRTWGQSLANADDVKLLAQGYEPMLTLQPTTAMPIASIAAGDGDAWLTAQLKALQAALAKASAARGHTLHGYLRFAHEMNGNWYRWGAPTGSPTAADLAAAQTTYKTAFRRVADLVHRYAPSVDVIWAANRSSTPNVAANDLLLWYPGDAWVDWIAVDGYNRIPTQWRTPTVLFDAFRARWSTTRNDLGGDPLADHVADSRPLMIAETSTIDAPTVQGATPQSDATWLDQLHAYLGANPQFRGLVWFNRPKRCSDFTTNLSCTVVNWNPQDGLSTKSLPWDWDSTTDGASAFRGLVQDTALFLPRG